jgi:hypothetical protein
MIIQIAQLRNELPLIKELLPIWTKYADGFIFLLDTNTDDTLKYLEEVKEQFNILEVLTYTESTDAVKMETDNRQLLFDTAKKYSNNIICLDADEYFDGTMSKEELEKLLEENPNTVFHLKWIQYTSVNSIRVDGPWKNNYKDRVGSYTHPCTFVKTQMHSTHLPIPENQQVIDPSTLFIAHLQWIDRNHVAIKQYFWKVMDFVNNKEFGVQVAGNAAYDASVNDFNWEEEYFEYPLQVRSDIFSDINNKDNYRVSWIKEQIGLHNIPNLGDWGLNIHESIPMYFCTAADAKHFPLLINMIGSIHKHNFNDTVEISVYDLGLTSQQITELSNIKRVKVYEVEKTNPDILTDIKTGVNRSVKGLFSWKPVAIKDCLDRHPYVLYLDSGTTILKPLGKLFKHIVQNGYLLFDCGRSIKHMVTDSLIDKFDLQDTSIMDENTFGIDAGFQGVSRQVYDSYVLPMYELSKDIKNFFDDGTVIGGWGEGRHDQTLYSILARKLDLNIEYHDNKDIECNLRIDGENQQFHITHTSQFVTPDTNIFRSRWNINYSSYKEYTSHIRRKYNISCITAIGKLSTYEKFIDRYFDNIQEQDSFDKIEFLIIYSEWSSKFEKFKSFDNIRFIQEDNQLGVYNAWNIGINNATAEYITNWNIDDLRYPINNKIKHDLLSNNIDLDLVYNYYVAVTAEQLEQGVDLESIPIQQYPDNYHLHTQVACMAGPDPLWRKAFHTFYGLFDHQNYSIIADWEMWRRMSNQGLKMKLIPHVLCIYVDHDDTVSKSSSTKVDEQKIKLTRQYTY